MAYKILKQMTFIAAVAGLTAPGAWAQDRAAHQERMARAKETIRQLQTAPLEGGAAARANPRIINGEFVSGRFDRGSWEFTASLQSTDPNGRRGHFCGGVLMAPVVDTIELSDGTSKKVVKSWDGEETRPRMMLTAAHCVHEMTDADYAHLEVVSGNVDLGANEKVRQRVEDVLIHEGYNDDTMAHDLAILLLADAAGPVPDGATPRSIAMPDLADTTDYKRVTAAHSVLGWGTTESGFLTQFLMSVRVPFSDQEACQAAYDNLGWDVHGSSFCAGFVTGGFDSCQGDSGGPLVHRPTTGANSNRLAPPVLTGIVSWGRGCGWPGFAGVYADVMEQRRWIEKTVSEKADHFNN